MIANWMATSVIFTLFLAVGALAAERLLRIHGRQARGVWIFAQAASLVWPVAGLALASRETFVAEAGDTVLLPTVKTALTVVSSSLPSIPDPWVNQLDALLLALWAIASVMLLARLVFAFLSLAAVERTATKQTIDGVPVLVTPALGPAVFGVRRVRLLMPQWLLELDDALRQLILRHEQEHSRAYDPQLTLVAAIAVALMPWNPVAWWTHRRLRLSIELDCDARVLRLAPDRERYARLLIFIAQRQTRNSLATMLAAPTSTLARRIAEMNVSRQSRFQVRTVMLAIGAAVAVACSGKYGTDLATSTASGSAVSTTSEVTTYYSPEGANPAALIEHPAPQYPAELRSQAVVGEVLAMFVVDSSGRVLDGSLRIVRSTDSLFTQAVRPVVAGMRFNPASFNGRKVRQVVQQAFVFDPSGTARPAPNTRPTTDPTNRNPMPLRPIVTSRR